MSKFNPGDLALIIRCSVAPEMVGRVVTLEVLVPPGGTTMFDGREWLCRSDQPAWVVSGEDLTSLSVSGALTIGRTSLLRECLLMPLRGDFAPTEQKAQEVPA